MLRDVIIPAAFLAFAMGGTLPAFADPEAERSPFERVDHREHPFVFEDHAVSLFEDRQDSPPASDGGAGETLREEAPSRLQAQDRLGAPDEKAHARGPLTFEDRGAVIFGDEQSTPVTVTRHGAEEHLAEPQRPEPPAPVGAPADVPGEATQVLPQQDIPTVEPTTQSPQPALVEAPISLAPAPSPGETIVHINVVVEGEILSVRAKGLEDDDPLIEASPIFTHLRGLVTIEGGILTVERFQDGAVLSIDFTNGEVRANDTVIGALPDFPTTDTAHPWLSVNAISVLTGTIVSKTEAGLWSFDLDDRLKPKFDLELWVNGEQQRAIDEEPRTIGPILLVPLEPVVDALGHQLERDGNIVQVTRAHDTAIITLDIATGLISVNSTPRGVTPNISYADPRTLLLPFTAIETLTGTHVVLEPGSSRVDVNLDDRLGGGVLPGERVTDEAKATGLVIESLDFLLSERGPQSIGVRGRLRNISGQLRYESVGSFNSPEELQPSRIALDYQTLGGSVGTLGDQSTEFRELAGVGVTRIRGASWRKRRPSGKILAIAAGLTLNGSTQVTEQASRPDFGGLAGGARLISADGSKEYGISARIDEDHQSGEVVTSYNTSFHNNTSGAGLKTLEFSTDAGVFIESGGEVSFDGRARVDARYDLSDQVGITASVSYDGENFIGDGSLGDTDNLSEEGPSSGALTVATVSADWRTRQNVGPLQGLSVGARSSLRRVGGDEQSSTISVSGFSNTRLRGTGIDLSVDAGYTRATENGVTETSQQATIRARKRTRWGTAQAIYTSSSQGTGSTAQSLIATFTARGIRRRLAKGASVNFAPTASAVWTPGSYSIRGGARLGADSGRLFGRKFSLSGQVSALQSFDPSDNDSTFFSSVLARYQFTQNLSVEASYFDNFSGERDFTAALRGRVVFNEPRRFTAPREGLGVLEGRVFFDKNRDGIRQDNEPGLRGVGVKLTGTGLGLRVDRDGNFTIQNLRAGLYDVAIDRRTLPLGFLVPETGEGRATIGDGRITRIDIPVIASGQIRGTLFADENSNGEVDKGERRLEGVFIRLQSVDGDFEPIVLNTVSFGQFSFESIPPGLYEIVVRIGGRSHTRTIELTDDNLFARLPFALTREEFGPPPEQVLEVVTLDVEA